MNDNMLRRTNENSKIIVKAIINGISRLSEKGVIVMTGILSLTFFSTVCVICATGSEMTVYNGKLEIRKLTT